MEGEDRRQVKRADSPAPFAPDPRKSERGAQLKLSRRAVPSVHGRLWITGLKPGRIAWARRDKTPACWKAGQR